jgi:hypothetical protein
MRAGPSRRFIRRATTCAVSASIIGLSAAAPAYSASAAPPTGTGITEHYQGKTFALSPGNWHGAKDCAIVSPTQAYCFNTDADFASFTSTERAADGSAIATTSKAIVASPDTTGVCNGWAKIWNGANFTNTGLAFEDYGTQQYLGDYVSVPFNVVSWFTDGKRSYKAMTNCWGFANDPGNITIHTNADATNDGGHEVSYILLLSGTG